jgi:hypothetical protein
MPIYGIVPHDRLLKNQLVFFQLLELSLPWRLERMDIDALIPDPLSALLPPLRNDFRDPCISATKAEATLSQRSQQLVAILKHEYDGP